MIGTRMINDNYFLQFQLFVFFVYQFIINVGFLFQIAFDDIFHGLFGIVVCYYIIMVFIDFLIIPHYNIDFVLIEFDFDETAIRILT